jgi:nucleoside 2-deoxyribosyltransferase
MKIYLAAKYSRNPEMRIFRDHIEGVCGHLVTSRWIEGKHDISEDADKDSQRTRFAEEDLQDLRHSDLVLWFSEPEKIEGRNRGGRHVEFGIALAYGIPIIVIGRKENVFHWLPQVRHLKSLGDALNLIQNAGDAE